MRRWWTDARAAADLVAGRADLWLPGALAWLLTVGWMPLLLAVARPPTVADLTFLGARMYTSGAWPWNAVAALTGALLVAVSAFGLVAVAETTLVGGGRRRLSAGRVLRVAALGFIASAPAVASVLAAATAFVMVAAREFTLPGVGDPMLRSLWRIAPFLVAIAVTWVAAGIVHAAAVREAVLGRAGVVEAIAATPRRLRAGGAGMATAALASALLRVAYLAFAAVLLGVLWQPISARLVVDGIDATVVPLLVGFVAIWLCLVLAGGALHAWASVTWTRVLSERRPHVDRARHRTQGAPHHP